ncbi:hypothetical protein SEA_WHOSEMANZ_32 [Gordonia phage WhoseManz]|nr:hypothetical protein SEA_WHOSEMANZ_32 [Gordonia phage WhoseManz]
MAARKLKTHVFLREPGALSLTSFGPDDTLPDWAVKLTEGKDHLFEEQEPDRDPVDLPLPKDQDPQADLDYADTGEAVGKEPAASEQGDTQLVDRAAEDEDDEPEQPRGNASREAWARFANKSGVPVTDEMSRDDIKAACADAGVLD